MDVQCLTDGPRVFKRHVCAQIVGASEGAQAASISPRTVVTVRYMFRPSGQLMTTTTMIVDVDGPNPGEKTIFHI